MTLTIVTIFVLIGFGVISQEQVNDSATMLMSAPFAIIGAFIGLCSLVIGLALAYWFITIPVILILL